MYKYIIYIYINIYTHKHIHNKRNPGKVVCLGDQKGITPAANDFPGVFFFFLVLESVFV